MSRHERWIDVLHRSATGTRRARTLLTPVGVAVLVFVPLFILVNGWELKAIEEPELLKRRGDEYAEYWRRTPMFIPGLRRGSGSENPARKATETPPNRKVGRDDR